MIDRSWTDSAPRGAAGAPRGPDAEGGLERTLRVIAHAARDSVPGFDHVGVTVLRDDGAATTAASTGEPVLQMDALQYQCGQGPCMDALRRERLVLVEHLEQQGHNWPLYARPAAEAGVHAQMGVRVQSGGAVLGSLNFYSMTEPTVDPRASARAEFFAAQTATALAYARHIEDLSSAEQPIGDAIDLVREQHQVSEEEAMYHLVRVATAAEKCLRDVAREVVERADLGDEAHRVGGVTGAFSHHRAGLLVAKRGQPLR